MIKTLPVSLLKKGDKFEFVSGRSDESKNAILVVTRDPAVNKTANSCHFRYQPDMSTTSADRGWDDNQSWNGTPDVQVRLVDVRSEVAPTSIAPQPSDKTSGKPVDIKAGSASKKKST